MSEKLPLPPLIEAICEFRFKPSERWNWTLPVLIYQRVGQDFSEYSRGPNFQIKETSGRIEVLSGADRVQLKRPDGSAMVQIWPNLLAINHLKPYPSWKTFREMILSLFDEYIGLAGETSIDRIGLRYINQIELPIDKPYSFDAYINLLPSLKGILKRPIVGFYQRYELLFESPKGMMIYQTAIQKSGQDNVLMIDLDFGSTEVESKRSVVESWLDDAHDLVHKSFVESLNPDFYERLRRGER